MFETASSFAAIALTPAQQDAAPRAAALWPLAWGAVLVWNRRERRAGGAARV